MPAPYQTGPLPTRIMKPDPLFSIEEEHVAGESSERVDSLLEHQRRALGVAALRGEFAAPFILEPDLRAVALHPTYAVFADRERVDRRNAPASARGTLRKVLYFLPAAIRSGLVGIAIVMLNELNLPVVAPVQETRDINRDG